MQNISSFEKADLINKIEQLFNQVRCKLSVIDITDSLYNNYQFSYEKDDLKKIITKILYTETHKKRKGKITEDLSSHFYNSSKGYYALKSNYFTKVKKNIIKIPPHIKIEPLPLFDNKHFKPEIERTKRIIKYGADIDSLALGKAGEFAVISELLFRGFEANIVCVDKGMDIIASTKENKNICIQVKTTTIKHDGTIQVTIPLKSYNKYIFSGIYYIVVVREIKQKQKPCINHFFIFPISTINDYIEKNYFKKQKNQICITIYQEENKFILKNNDFENILESTYNRFDKII